MISWLNLLCMANHNTKAPFNYSKEYPEWWDWWVKDCTKYYKQWFKCVMHEAKMREVPTLFIRFEDLVSNPEPELVKIMRFMTQLKDLDGTNAERRIKEVIAKGKKAT